jgi:hypothetical protein
MINTKSYRFTRRVANGRKFRRGRIVNRRIGYGGEPATCRHPGGHPWMSGRKNRGE